MDDKKENIETSGKKDPDENIHDQVKEDHEQSLENSTTQDDSLHDDQVEELNEEQLKRRVKVYEMTDSGNWNDKGTGFVQCVYNQHYSLVVRSEKDGSGVMNSEITQTEYTRQQDTLILWSDPTGVDLALSFQEAKGCDEMWNQIMDAQKRIAADKNDIDQLPHMDDFELKVPSPQLSNLVEMERVFLIACRHQLHRDTLLKLILETDFLDKFLPLLESCEDLDNIDDCYRLGNIMRAIFFLNNTNVYVTLFRDKYFTEVLGMLEYDREYPNTKGRYREYFANDVKFKQVIPITNEDVVTKIQQVYRATYMKDVALARNLEDSTFSALNSLIYYNHGEILSYIQSDNYMSELFKILENQEVDKQKLKDTIRFFNELCVIVRPFQKETRVAFYRYHSNGGILKIFQKTLADEDISIRTGALAILSSIVEHNPAPVRSFCLAQVKSEEETLIGFLISRFLNEGDSGLCSQLVEIIRIILDTSGIGSVEVLTQTVDSDLDRFLEYFYTKHCDNLFKPLTELMTIPLETDPNGADYLPLSQSAATTMNFLCELLCFIITQHAMFSKNYLLHHDILKSTSILLKAKQSYLRLSALRVFRVCLCVNDEFYRRLLIKNDIFGKLFACLMSTQGRNNCLNSACLELFESIRSESSKQLVSHIVTNFKRFFDSLDYCTIFKSLQLKYEQSIEPPPSPEKSTEK
ncbi:component of IIS longevity pathway SMK-1-domain-containing protein [Globomyces pollinis-pini]|nr:component of IIS longevity pathway SMK-1-domain-containing protein [Globomyces pollinis-pini]